MAVGDFVGSGDALLLGVGEGFAALLGVGASDPGPEPESEGKRHWRAGAGG